jgi:hypothetical protein
MKSFGEYLADKEVLDEGVFRAATITSFAAKSRGAGNDAQKSFKRGLQHLSVPTKGMTKDQRFDRLDAVLTAILDGLVSTRHQFGSGVAVNAAGHLMTAKALEAKSKKR